MVPASAFEVPQESPVQESAVDPRTVPLPEDDDDPLQDPLAMSFVDADDEKPLGPAAQEDDKTLAPAAEEEEKTELGPRIDIQALKKLFWFWLAALRKLRLWLTVVKWRRRVLFLDPSKKRVSLVGLKKTVEELEQTLEHDDTQLRKLLVKIQNGTRTATATDRYGLMLCQRFLLDYCSRRLCRARSDVEIVLQEVKSGRFQMDAENLVEEYDMFISCDVRALSTVMQKS